RSWRAISAPPTRRAIWRRVQAGLRAPVTHPRFVRCLGAAGLLYGGALLNESRYDPIDWLLLAPPATFLGWSARGRRRLWRGALELGCVLVAFALASYGFTVLKASLFLGAEPLDHWLMSAETAVFGEPAHRLAYAWAIDHPELVVKL